MHWPDRRLPEIFAVIHEAERRLPEIFAVIHGLLEGYRRYRSDTRADRRLPEIFAVIPDLVEGYRRYSQLYTGLIEDHQGCSQ